MEFVSETTNNWIYCCVVEWVEFDGKDSQLQLSENRSVIQSGSVSLSSVLRVVKRFPLVRVQGEIPNTKFTLLVVSGG